MTFRQYTFCVSRDDFNAFNWGAFIGPLLVLVGGIVAAFFISGPGAILAAIGALWAIEKVCNFLLGGKMICLGETPCVVGRVVELEPVGHGKSGFEKIDNDFSVNLLLAPHLPSADRPTIEGDGLQGRLIAQKSPELDGLEFGGYTSHGIPVLHTEFEGSRIKDFCDTAPAALAIAAAIMATAAVICFIPVVGWVACLFVVLGGLALAAAIVTAMITDAWNNAEGGSPEHAAVQPGDGDLHAMNPDTHEGGDYVVMTGRWVWDGGHVHEEGTQGWTELHPAMSVHKIETVAWTEGSDQAAIDAFRLRLDDICAVVGSSSSPLTVAAQAEPENSWVIHPAVDGCAPEDKEEEEPPEPH
jgi:hypothetical protein